MANQNPFVNVKQEQILDTILNEYIAMGNAYRSALLEIQDTEVATICRTVLDSLEAILEKLSNQALITARHWRLYKSLKYDNVETLAIYRKQRKF